MADQVASDQVTVEGLRALNPLESHYLRNASYETDDYQILSDIRITHARQEDSDAARAFLMQEQIAFSVISPKSIRIDKEHMRSFYKLLDDFSTGKRTVDMGGRFVPSAQSIADAALWDVFGPRLLRLDKAAGRSRGGYRGAHLADAGGGDLESSARDFLEQLGFTGDEAGAMAENAARIVEKGLKEKIPRGL